jgi:hypothetical protein
MYSLHFLTALANSLPLSLLFAFLLRRPGIWGNFYLFLLAVLLGSWAGGLWLPPLGPRVAEVPWGGFFLSALILSVLFSLMPSPHLSNPPGHSAGGQDSKPERQPAAQIFLGLFGGCLILGLTFLILGRYFLIWLFSPFPL